MSPRAPHEGVRVDASHAHDVAPLGERVRASLRVEGLCFARSCQLILDDVNFTLEEGRLLAIVGPSGAGKSTLLALLAGFETAHAGRIVFHGVEWQRQSPVERGIGMSFDDGALHEHLTVAQNLDSAAVSRGDSREVRRARVASLAQSLGVTHLVDRAPATLSAGERRRIAVARVFVRSPRLALLDEPLANLDRSTRYTVRALVRDAQRSSGTTTIVVTHDPTDALAIADDLLVLINGRVRACGPAGEISSHPIDLEVAQLVDDLGMHVITLTREQLTRGEAHDPLHDPLHESTPDAATHCWFAPAFTERITAAMHDVSHDGTVLLGVRPWHIRVGAPREPSIVLDAKLIAREGAGIFTDLLAQRADGRVLRARVDAHDAQDLPMHAMTRFHVHERDLHLFAGPWPGTRLTQARL